MTLIIAGLGIKSFSHLTKETEKIIENSDRVLYLTNDLFYPTWIHKVNNNAVSLNSVYFSKSKREDAYNLIKDIIVKELVHYTNVVFIIYGHPTFLSSITSLLSAAAKLASHKVHILPAISSLDCLLADLCLNPADGGMQIMDATELLLFKKHIDISCHIVILQIATIGQKGHEREHENLLKGMHFLYEYLLNFYNEKQEIILYEASQYTNQDPKVATIFLKEAITIKVSSKTTLYIPPIIKKKPCTAMLNIFNQF